MTLRHIAGLATIDKESELCPDFPTKARTEDEYADAHKGFDMWWESDAERIFTYEQGTAAYFAIWGLVSATRQLYYENGFRAGASLMRELMDRSPDPSALEFRGRDAAEAERERKKKGGIPHDAI